LAKQLVDQRGLAVVDVGDDRDISEGGRHARDSSGKKAERGASGTWNSGNAMAARRIKQ
jgi:hypothetical protein